MHNPTDDIAVNPDSAVIEKIRKGDIALFEVLIRRYNPVLYKIAKSYGFNHQDAEDLMQDTHVAAYLAINGFEGRSSYKTWLSRIMVNKCIYKLKYGYFKNEIASEFSQTTHQPMYAKENQPEEKLLNRELALILERSLQTIPLHYRTVFVLRELEGFSVAETAELLQLTPVNVKVRLNRAKALLQKKIEQFYSHTELFAFNLIYCDAIVHRVFAKINAIENNKPGSDGAAFPSAV
jgi:RNA polymerase sigma-70 factor (ECF subfamily)